MKGSIQKHVAKDGTITWRVRMDYYEPQTGRRHQLQRTFATKREAEAGAARWRVELEPDHAPGARRAPHSRAAGLPESTAALPLSPLTCLREIARIASDLQWRRQDLSRDQVTRLLKRIESCAQAGMDFLEPEETQGTQSATAPPDAEDVRYHVYRLLADGVPFYVGQSSDVPSRVRVHIRQATGTRPGRSARATAIRDALAAGQSVTYDIVASASTEREIRRLERNWILDMLVAGYTMANGATL